MKKISVFFSSLVETEITSQNKYVTKIKVYFAMFPAAGYR
jgi:hypothetical protein